MRLDFFVDLNWVEFKSINITNDEKRAHFGIHAKDIEYDSFSKFIFDYMNWEAKDKLWGLSTVLRIFGRFLASTSKMVCLLVRRFL